MRKVAFVGLLVAAVTALGCGAGGGDGGLSAGAGSDEETGKGAKIGEPARDGKFEFVVQKVKCGVSEVGNDFLGAKAQGQFCLVTVKVTNIGKEPQSFFADNQKGFDADGTEFSTDSEAGLYANKDADAVFTRINPGNSITGIIVFDIPKKAKLARLELHDSAFSGGVTVNLA